MKKKTVSPLIKKQVKKAKRKHEHIYQIYIIPAYSYEVKCGNYGMADNYADRYETVNVPPQEKARCVKCFKEGTLSLHRYT